MGRGEPTGPGYRTVKVRVSLVPFTLVTEKLHVEPPAPENAAISTCAVICVALSTTCEGNVTPPQDEFNTGLAAFNPVPVNTTVICAPCQPSVGLILESVGADTAAFTVKV